MNQLSENSELLVEINNGINKLINDVDKLINNVELLKDTFLELLEVLKSE